MKNIKKQLHKFLIENAYLLSQSNFSIEYYFEIPASAEIPPVISAILAMPRDFGRECRISTRILPDSPDTRRFNVKIQGGWLYGWGDKGRPIEEALKECGLIEEE